MKVEAMQAQQAAVLYLEKGELAWKVTLPSRSISRPGLCSLSALQLRLFFLTTLPNSDLTLSRNSDQAPLKFSCGT